MAERSTVHVWIYLATLVLLGPSVAFSKFDNITNAKPINNLTGEMKDYSGKPEVPQVLNLEESGGDLSHTRPSGERFGSYLPTSVLGRGEEPVEKTEDHIENNFNEFLTQDKKIMLSAASNKVSQMGSVTTVRPDAEEALVEHTLQKGQPSKSEMLQLFSNSKNIDLDRGSSDRIKPLSTNEKLSSHSHEGSLQILNHIEHDKEQERGKGFLSTVRPTISTIALIKATLSSGQTSPVTEIQKLQIESGDEHLRKVLQKNTLDTQDSRARNNFLDNNLIPKEQGMQPSEKYNAAYRTTEGYTALQLDSGPGGNEVVSADTELNHKSMEYPKGGNTIFEESKSENKTNPPHFSPVIQEKQIIHNVPHGSDISTSTHGTSGHLLPLSPSLQDEPSTLRPSLNKTSPFASFDPRSHFTLEAKSRTQTEQILPAPTKTFRTEINNEATNGLISYSQDIPPSSMQPHETPTPAMQIYGKNSEKSQVGNGSLVEAGKGSAKPATTQKGPMASSAPPGLLMSTTWKMSETRQKDLVPQTLQPQKGETTTPHIVMNVSRRTGRRGEIIVTTQRAVQRPRMMGVPTSSPSKKPTAETPLCTKAGGACEYLGSNKTLLNWDDLQRTLSFAWDMHVYGSGTLFALLAVIALVNLIGSPIVCVPYLPYIITSNALLFVIGILRSVFFLLDPYATKSKISHGLALVLYNITFPLMLSTFAILVLLVMKIASLQLLPPKLQTLPLLGFIGVIHFIVLLSADLLTHLLNPSVNIVLQILSISWGIFLMVGNFVAYYRLRGSSKDIANENQRVSPTCEDIVSVQTQERNMRCLFTSSRVLLVSSFFGLLCCGLQVYAVLWLYGLLGKKNEFTWSWWFLQFWFRIFELGLCFSLLFVASHSFCQQCSSSDHTCWSKIISYFCTYKKAEVAEYPNNCYDWTNSIQERVVNNNISKSLIRNEPENVPLKMLKENNEIKSGSVLCNNSSPASPLFKPRPDVIFGPKSQNMIIGRSYTSICFEKESMLSLTDLEFRPPSPINLSRSIDEALFREHLVRDSIFLDSSLQYPSYLTRQESCSSLKESSAMNQTVDPLISSDLKMRRCSNPDYMYTLARSSSMTEVDSPSEDLQQSKDLPRDITTENVVSGSSMDSVSKGSIKISWNPWRHGLSSVESLPLEEAPSTQLLKQGSQPSIRSKGSEPEKTFGKRFIERSQTTDSNSLASDTIEL
ncbi:hypothetical protein XENTR_v10012833 [Xenopus tropicalis]|uniref:Proline-rich transmembrane protein 3 n=1 Tax=Xenopus tropicalis TaxID=8364 RepID=A0A8J0R173_XENTR|nr:proline-rich transmembrane protein 3 [Xenopus tropicalis]XP_004914161.1 proline-rich transmembrane protein 3 [Xenopus tropicalis]XP_031757049.1 proline-rich transmembrane protein 3 [Xenopus tropicalis]KAE8612368.1 hypothetical protein XENTR_v10012833 [Xenopus tropicalis]KAE8612369.1 hypothetical protein XENTR_v10012833 [Xenopus tropicalis]KAE8612370.1 hypothetical protein XENTR_v10012833 [Xenopus tropicalis]|eukprot:XP_004914160.1 PREDICTED: proline-rich transmembrane protein 3 [Xenopus tropicalis]